MSAYYKQAFILLGALFVLGCGGNTSEQQRQGPPPPTPVTAVKATRSSATYYDTYPASVTAVTEVELRPQVSGYITGVFFQEGRRVRKGQKLYTIDQQQYRASYDQAIANLNAAKANLVRAQKDAERYNTLAQQDAVARQLVDNAQATLASAEQQVAAAQANVRQVQTSLEYATIYAPFEGTIGISQVRLGAAVTPGQTLLNTISADNPIAVDIAIDETEIQRFAQLQRQQPSARDSLFVLMLPSGTRYGYTGRILTIDRAVDPQTGTIRIRLGFPNPDGQLKAGLNGNVLVKNSTDAPQLLIPYQAVTEQMSEYFVYVVGDSSKVTQKKVTLGARINDKVIVKNGLNEGEVVVTEGTQKVREGSVVQVNPPGQAGAQQQPAGKQTASVK
ncbi:efflux RND transporter periplasmic adaptor subunit [Fibrisoma montanum]|uniref:Efflux RND transporter periplasmic adaptor subunit n=1 Tax=Fibrisoma montanum TaxID=2305895 RepID=A0A418MBF9_9BACT|nr:efflux RND transporter periplasmic adaptor subunit [Fibrisoma montanum]RIV23694.1 efflux RND transporter periplasmic adaptor subunit [Fibrisoma montanum]